MTDLSKSTDPRRALTWNGKQLAQCSQKELIACIIHLARQVAIADEKIKALSAPDLTYNKAALSIQGE